MITLQQTDWTEVVSSCLRQDRKAQEVLYKHFYSKMKIICLRYAKDADAASDILQDGFLKVFDNLEKYDQKGSLEGWMKRVFVNHCIDLYRKDKKSILEINSEKVERFDAETDDETQDLFDNYNLSSTQVMNAIQQLSPVYKLVFNLYVFEELPHQEIAEQLGINVGTSKSNLSKARQNLRTLLTKQKTN